MSVRFEETQRLRQPWLWAVVSLVGAFTWVVVGGTLLGLDLGLGEPPPPWLAVVLLAVLGVGLPWLVAWSRLWIGVGDDELRFAFRPFVRRTVPLRDVVAAEAIEVRPLRDWLGQGIRWVPGRGWAYLAYGRGGVRVRLVSGRSFVLGTQRPAELAAALQAAREGSPR